MDDPFRCPPGGKERQSGSSTGQRLFPTGDASGTGAAMASERRESAAKLTKTHEDMVHSLISSTARCIPHLATARTSCRRGQVMRSETPLLNLNAPEEKS
eukprot:s1683_g1.t1